MGAETQVSPKTLSKKRTSKFFVFSNSFQSDSGAAHNHRRSCAGVGFPAAQSGVLVVRYPRFGPGPAPTPPREDAKPYSFLCKNLASAAFALVVLLNSPALLWYAPVVGLVS